jgi:peptide/nickel transport system permease protein
VLARTMAAGQLDVLVAALVTLAGGLIGIGIGILAGMLGGATDNVWMRLMDALLAFPPLVLALGISVGLGAGTISAAIGITVATVPYYARLMRAEVLRVKALPFVEAATVSGCRRGKLIRRHVIPHTWRVLSVQASSSVGYSVLTLAALGFVGLGVQAPTAEWGSMISEGLSYMTSGNWWIGVFPGILLLLLVTGCNLIADGFGAERRLRWSRPSLRLREAA